MRRTNVIILKLLFLCVSSFTSCINDEEEGRTITGTSEYILTVASKQVPGVLFSSGSNFLADVYAVKKEQSNEWMSFVGIDGFEYEPHYEYRIRISETNFLDYTMGDPAWTEYKLLEIISKEKKDSEGVPAHFIPEWYYKGRYILAYKSAIEAENKTVIEDNLKSNSILPLNCHCLLYGSDIKKWIILDKDNHTLGKGILKMTSKSLEDFPDSYKILMPEGQIISSNGMEWRFLDESEEKSLYPPFDIFLVKTEGLNTSTVNYAIPYLYHDLTEYYQSKYPDAGVETVVVAYYFSSLVY